jgi:hypothetical protein
MVLFSGFLLKCSFGGSTDVMLYLIVLFGMDSLFYSSLKPPIYYMIYFLKK